MKKILSLSLKHPVPKIRPPLHDNLQEEFYDFEAPKPPGIRNYANSCFANAVLQCTMNNSIFTGLIEEILDKHHNSGCTMCQGMNLCVAGVLDQVSTLYKYGDAGIRTANVLNLEPCLRGMSYENDRLIVLIN